MSFGDLVDWLCSRHGRQQTLTATAAGPVEIRVTGQLSASRPPGQAHVFVFTVDDVAITIAAAAFRTARLLRSGSVEAEIGGITLNFTES